MSKQATKRVRKAINFEVCRDKLPKYSSIGCYPIYYLASDGETMCADCVNSNIELIDDAIKSNDDSGWRIVAADANWEDGNMICCNCNERIESAYVEDEKEAE